MAKYDDWCARRESNPRPSASETRTEGIIVTIVYNLVRIFSPINQQQKYIAHNLSARNASLNQYHHDLVNP